MDRASSIVFIRRKGLWRRFFGWFRDVPVTDSVDRRNASMLLSVLAIVSVAPPLAWAYRMATSAMPWSEHEALSFFLSAGVSVIAAIGMFLVRRGHFQAVARAFLFCVATAMFFNHVDSGLAAQTQVMPLHVIWIVIAGLVVGRNALWLMFTGSILATTLGLMVDITGPKASDLLVANEIASAAVSIVVLLLLAIVMDRSFSALRETATEAARCREELQLVNQQLISEAAERGRLQNLLIHSQKVEVVGRMTSGVTHDFNHLLSLILGFVRRGRSAEDPIAIRKALDGVETAANRATSLCQKILNFSRSDVSTDEIIDVGLVLHELQPMLHQLVSPEIRINLEIDSDQQLIALDRSQFELVVLNLAANADDAMPSGGELQISLQATEATGVQMTLSDNGVGMSKEVKSKVFDAFFTTKPAGRGTGLGLSLARDLIVAAGGSLHVESELGQGSRFILGLPRAQRCA